MAISVTLQTKTKGLKPYKKKVKKLSKHLRKAKSLSDEIAFLNVEVKPKVKRLSSH